MKELKEDMNTVARNTQSLAETEVKLLKLNAVAETSQLVSFVFSRFVFLLLAVIAYAILVVSAGLYLNHLLHSIWLGLTISGAGSLCMLVLLYLFRKVLLEYPVQDYVIHNLSNKLEL